MQRWRLQFAGFDFILAENADGRGKTPVSKSAGEGVESTMHDTTTYRMKLQISISKHHRHQTPSTTMEAPAMMPPPSIKSINASIKKEEEFRTYSITDTSERVIQHYKDMRTNQTVKFYNRMEHKYSFENGAYRRLMTIEEAFVELENYIDASDPDMDLPNLLHLLQTAEGIRNAGHPDWLQLVGLLHDVGKIMFLWGDGADGQDGYSPKGKQWALGGDTWVVGCRIPNEAVVFPEFNPLNPDMSNPQYNTKYGIYEQNCGLDELRFAWGHDEYMYRMLGECTCDLKLNCNARCFF